MTGMPESVFYCEQCRLQARWPRGITRHVVDGQCDVCSSSSVQLWAFDLPELMRGAQMVLPACLKCRTRFDPAGEYGQGPYHWRGRQPCYVCKRKRQLCEKVEMNAAKLWVAAIEHRSHPTAWDRLLGDSDV